MNELKLREKCKVSTNTKNDKFVGIKYAADGVCVHFPLGYRLPKSDEECRICIIDLLSTISKSKSIINENVTINDVLTDDPEFPISAYIWIINDYFKNGIYQAKEKIITKQQNGKINWKSTLKQKPFVDGDSVIYLNPMTNHLRYSEDFLTEIHLLCLSESFNHLGWLFGDYYVQPSQFDLSMKEQAIWLLNKEYSKSFDDRKKMLIIQMKNILLGLNDKSNKSTLNNYGIEDFHNIWEIVLKKLFGNIDVKQYYPKSTWHLNGVGDENGSKMRPDIILKNEDNMFVIDAKYYRYGDTNQREDAIPTSSIQKQIVYGQYVELVGKSKENIKNVFNAFVVPYNKEKGNELKLRNGEGNILKNDIEYVGFADVEWIQKETQSYDLIALIFADTRFIVENWTYGINKIYINEIVIAINFIRPELEKRGWIINN